MRPAAVWDDLRVGRMIGGRTGPWAMTYRITIRDRDWEVRNDPHRRCADCGRSKGRVVAVSTPVGGIMLDYARNAWGLSATWRAAGHGIVVGWVTRKPVPVRAPGPAWAERDSR